jgi:ABC-type transport system involved in multi-copper enzyme maturation permease subunit
MYFTGGRFSWIQAALAFFCALNVLICCWEISLGKQISLIKSDLDKLRKVYKDNDRIRACTRFFMLPLGISDIFSSRYWSVVWSTYSLYDPSYSNQESYGFFIDVGNGWSTLIPSIIVVVGMTLQDRMMSARSLGMLMLVKFYQVYEHTRSYACIRTY